MADILTYDDEELVAVAVDERNWRGIGISLLVIAAIFSLIGLAIFILTPPNEIDNLGIHKLDLKEIVHDRFKPSHFRTQWVSETHLLLEYANGSVMLMDTSRNYSHELIIHSTVMSRFNIVQTKLSPDRQLLLLQTAVRQDLSYTSLSDYYIYNVTSESILSVHDELLRPLLYSNYTDDHEKLESLEPLSIHLQFADWGPKSTQLVVIADNDIFYCEQVLGTTSILYRITNDGQAGSVYNGIADWLYSPFVGAINYDSLSTNRQSVPAAIYWAPDGSSFCYATFNDTNVRKASIKLYTNFRDIQTVEPQSQQTLWQRYPLAGQSIPEVQLTVVQLKSNNSNRFLFHSLKPTSIASVNRSQELDQDFYLSDLSWISSNKVLLVRTSRHYNFSRLDLCELSNTVHCRLKLQLEGKQPPPQQMTQFTLKNASLKKQLLFRYPRQFGHNATRYHVATLSLKKQDKYLHYYTDGDFDVHRLLRTHKNYLYFQASLQGKLHSRHIFRLQLDPTADQLDQSTVPKQPAQPECITCSLYSRSILNNLENDTLIQLNSNKDDLDQFIGRELQPQLHPDLRPVECEHFEVSFSWHVDHFVLTCEGPSIPFAQLWSIKNSNLKMVMNLQTHEELRQILKPKRMPRDHFLQITLEPEPGLKITSAQLRVITPPPPTREQREEAEEEELEITYPLLLQSVSLEPLQNPIDCRFWIDLPYFLASQREYIYAQLYINWPMTNAGQRSSINIEKGDDTWPTIGQQALYRLQLKALQHLLQHFPSVDPKRVILIGYASGASTALGTLIEDEKSLILGAIAVAPVVNWRLMDSITAEYNFGSPHVSENMAKYEKANLLHKRDALIKRKFLVVHGTADEQVHVQHTMQLTKLLVDNYEPVREGPIGYQIHLYPDENHRLSGSKQHFLSLVDLYTAKFFGPKRTPSEN